MENFEGNYSIGKKIKLPQETKSNRLLFGGSRSRGGSLSPKRFESDSVGLNSPILRYLCGGGGGSPIAKKLAPRGSRSPLSSVENLIDRSPPPSSVYRTPVKAVDGEEVLVMDGLPLRRSSRFSGSDSSGSSGKSLFKADNFHSPENSGGSRHSPKVQLSRVKEDLRPNRLTIKKKTESQAINSPFNDSAGLLNDCFDTLFLPETISPTYSETLLSTPTRTSSPSKPASPDQPISPSAEEMAPRQRRGYSPARPRSRPPVPQVLPGASALLIPSSPPQYVFAQMPAPSHPPYPYYQMGQNSLSHMPMHVYQYPYPPTPPSTGYYPLTPPPPPLPQPMAPYTNNSYPVAPRQQAPSSSRAKPVTPETQTYRPKVVITPGPTRTNPTPVTGPASADAEALRFWSPEDDGIEAGPPCFWFSENALSREQVDALIEKVLNSVFTKKRLPVFSEFCTDSESKQD